ncbi:ScbR family autoregulator-binding transcription factor [Kitasatospora kazusensis]|uniref:ScbR family autoregulator-binding transcription factor n=1 Tax=Kitasatospora kazusensis TaxID=407974 RepID=A0ABN2ZIP4_9ACTN
MVQQARAVQTRQEILRAAADVFDRRGYAAATMAEIISVAGVTKGAVYFHFTSKEELALAVVAEQSPWLDMQDIAAPGMQAVIDLTMAYARALLNDSMIRAAVRLVIEQGTFENPDRDAYQASASLVRSLVVRAEESGDLLPGLDPSAVAETVTASFAGIQLTSQALSNRRDLLHRLKDFWTLLLPGLVPPERLPELNPAGSKPARRSRS